MQREYFCFAQVTADMAIWLFHDKNTNLAEGFPHGEEGQVIDQGQGHNEGRHQEVRDGQRHQE